MQEYDNVGRDAFLTLYGFKSSSKFVVTYNGHEYDAKALLAAAHGSQHPDEGPLPHNFSGDEQAAGRFRTLGFMVVFLTIDVLAKVRSSFGERLVPSRLEAEREAITLLDVRVGNMTREEAFRLGKLFNRHAKSERLRRDRFLPAFAGAARHPQPHSKGFH